MKIQILGPGCRKCNQLAVQAEEAAKGLGLDYEIEKITDMNEIMKFGVFMTPGLVVDGTVQTVGKVPSPDELKKILGG